ncbi:MAG: hypothetical protein RJB13_435, partial [Pseudomonadota bacterium]
MLKHAAIKSFRTYFALGAFLVTGCVGHFGPSSLNPELRRNVSDEEPAHKFSDELYAILPESKESLNKFSKSSAGKKVSQFIGRNLTSQDVDLLVAL